MNKMLQTGFLRLLRRRKSFNRSTLRLSKLNHIVVDVDYRNVLTLADSVDVILDGTDNFETRMLLNDAALRLGETVDFWRLYRSRRPDNDHRSWPNRLPSLCPAAASPSPVRHLLAIRQGFSEALSMWLQVSKLPKQ